MFPVVDFCYGKPVTSKRFCNKFLKKRHFIYATTIFTSRLPHVTHRICSKSTPKRNMLSLVKENLRMLRLRLRLHLHLNLRPLVKVGQELKVNISFF